MDKIYAMKLFVRVAERESFSRAAEDIGLPKGSVSRQIQALEHQLGIRLLHRTTRRAPPGGYSLLRTEWFTTNGQKIC